MEGQGISMAGMREPGSEPIPGYRLIEPIGSGGFGEVWSCEAPGGLRKAIKFVFGNLNSLDVDAVHAEQELAALERIKEVRHPFICSLDRIEVNSGQLIIVMELCDKTLHDVFDESRRAGHKGIPRTDLLRYLRDAAEALDYLNERHKLQHLDVKPRNLFLVGERAKVADFGLVKHLEKLTGSGLLGGVTPLYAAPETFNGQISERSDQYSLAVVYQEMLTGHRPITGKNVRQIAQQHLQGKPDLQPLPSSDRAVVAKALAKDPSERYPSCLAFIGALLRAQTPLRVRLPDPQMSAVAAGSEATRSVQTLEEIFLDLPDGHSSGEEIDDAEDRTVVRSEEGCLRPTLYLGVGSFGREALLQLRCRLVDRFGELGRIPVFRFLCIDTDSDLERIVVRGAPEVAFSTQELHRLTLQPVTNYRKRMLDKLTEWLPREKLYSMPRSLQPQGSRALARLAFVDNYQRLLARVRRELEECCRPKALAEAVTAAGLSPADRQPRVCILASAGGSSSGWLVDLAYAVRRLLDLMRHTDAEIVVHLHCGAPSDPATPTRELANTYATLTELNHFADATTVFTAEYGADGQRMVEETKPVDAVYLLPLEYRSPDCFQETIARLASYLLQESTTQFGSHVRRVRREGSHSPGLSATPFRTLGTYSLWFPQGLLLRHASRILCRRLIDGWLVTDPFDLGGHQLKQIEPICSKILEAIAANPDEISERITASCQPVHFGQTRTGPVEAVYELLTMIEQQAQQPLAREEPGQWCKQALGRVREWIGGVSALDGEQWRKTRVSRAFQQAVKEVAKAAAEQSLPELQRAMELPGPRVALAEAALDTLQRKTAALAKEQLERVFGQRKKVLNAWQELEAAVNDCFAAEEGGFRLFANRVRRRSLAAFTEKLWHFSKERIAEETAQAVYDFYLAFSNELEEQRRDIAFCRQRLQYVRDVIETPPLSNEDLTATLPSADLTVSRTPIGAGPSALHSLAHAGSAQVLLPDRESDIERAALNLLDHLTGEDWQRIDHALQEKVLAPREGLYAACMRANDLMRGLAQPLISETTELLAEFLPQMDVAQIVLKQVARRGDDDERSEFRHALADYFRLARLPIDTSDETLSDSRFVIFPDSEAGKQLEAALKDAECILIRASHSTDMVFCREIGPLKVEQLRPLLRMCRKAYEELGPSPVASPHSRFDIRDWIPLDV